MRELDAIIDQYELLKKAGTECVLATVVHVEGSSYRRAGARMLVDEFGSIIGAISGGCLEGDALRKALHALYQKRNKLVTYDTSNEDDAVIGAQLGCNGIIQVLFEPLQYEDRLNPCELLKTLIHQSSPAVIVVQFDQEKKQQAGTRLIISHGSEVQGKMLAGELLDPVLGQARKVLKQQRSQFAEVMLDGEAQHFFLQAYEPPVKLVVVGAGNDSQILSQQAQLLGWEVVVVDGRPTHANEERFAGSCQIIVSKPEQTLENIQVDNRSCFVLMSHNYNYDLAVLKLLLSEKQIPYIGILGPLKKYERMQSHLEEEGVYLNRREENNIYAPVGLDLGAETPAEIGLSILAEIQAVLKGRDASFLRNRLTPIHAKKETEFMQIQL